jgi:UDP-N-acetylmuramate--alanine ligase
VLSTVDVLVLSEVYAAGEAPLAMADGRSLARTIRQLGRVDPIFAETVEDIPGLLEGVVRDDDVVVTMGAGTIGGLAGRLQAQGGRH